LTEEEYAVEGTIGIQPGAKGENFRYDEGQVAKEDEQIGGHDKYG
jgi:hypothetical protein